MPVLASADVHAGSSPDGTLSAPVGGLDPIVVTGIAVGPIGGVLLALDEKLDAVTSVSVIVPVYNSAATVVTLVGELSEALRVLVDTFEIILVDDRSTDASWAQIASLALDRTAVRGIRLTRNVGEQHAVLCGIQAARYSVSVTIDDDLQQPPAEISRLLVEIERGADLVYGRPLHTRHSAPRVALSVIAKFMLEKIAGVPHATGLSSMRAFRTDLRERFGTIDGSGCSVDALLTQASSRRATVRVRHEPRRDGSSNYSVRTLVGHTMGLLTAMATTPFRWVGLLGSLFTAIGLMGFVATALAPLFVEPIGEVAGLMIGSALLTVAGAQLLALWLIGEYAVRIRQHQLSGAAYHVDSQVGDE